MNPSFLEYIHKSSDDELKYFFTRLVQNYSGDLSGVLNRISVNHKLNYMFGSCKTCEDLYSLIDQFAEVVKKEVKKRKLDLTKEMSDWALSLVR